MLNPTMLMQAASPDQTRGFSLVEILIALLITVLVMTSVFVLQVQYVQGLNEVFEDAPVLLPVGADPSSWVTRVRITVGGRSESANVEGSTDGVFAAEDTHMRRFTTTVSLRNQLSPAQQKAIDLGLGSWN